ncbi:HAMP domain-containing histidine kinase [Clostridium sp. D2Q-14]|uniref:sensor histidine kinase n=1 Tax=Anaeromonas gelatinilytica TaxID=2683194 RepID=UPI00193B932E|nr:HAMP domain-containing sensor histidine kinase [Anaeromonas gelatinilytica]MBS4534456.1 HAMP domain-containing histidine kinase [Anaeromonas gelatinilytica]
MKKCKSNRQSFYIVIAVILFLAILLFDFVTIRMEYMNYQDKVRILCKMISEEDMIQSATRILKGSKDMNIEAGEKILADYGYQLENQNALYQLYKEQCTQIITLSIILYITCVLIIWAICIIEKQKRKMEIGRLEEVLSNYRKEIYDIPDISSNDFINKDTEKLYFNIQSFGDYLKLLSKRIYEEKEETKSLVTDISHQLKTPVAALKTSFEILQQDDLNPDEKKEFSYRRNLQLKGIENLLEALINISRMETGMVEIKMENLCIFETILDAVNRVHLKAEEKRIQIEMDADEDLQELMLPHDKKWLSEALINILDNAIKYSPTDTCIIIRMMKRITFLRIEIEDQGIGIPKCDYNQVFKRFYRGNSKEVKAQTGSGVGLYLTREIINRHNGTISVSSGEKGVGSKFIIQLPYRI